MMDSPECESQRRLIGLPVSRTCGICELGPCGVVRGDGAISMRLRLILTDAAERIEALPECERGWPVRGHDRESTLDLLRVDLMPQPDQGKQP